MVTCGKTVLQCHSRVTNTDAGKTQATSTTTEVARVVLSQTLWLSPSPRRTPHRPPSPRPWPLATTNLLSISMILPFGECYINGIIQYVLFGGWLFPLRVIPWRFIQTVLCVKCVLLSPSIIPVCRYSAVCSTITILKRTWVVSSSGLLQIKLL